MKTGQRSDTRGSLLTLGLGLLLLLMMVTSAGAMSVKRFPVEVPKTAGSVEMVTVEFVVIDEPDADGPGTVQVWSGVEKKPAIPADTAGAFEIPATVTNTVSGNTYTVTEVGAYAFYGCTGLTSLTIGDSVQTIGLEAFSGCTGLTSLTIGDSVATIEQGAFSGCTGLTSLTIGDSVETIEKDAFANCDNISATFVAFDYKGNATDVSNLLDTGTIFFQKDSFGWVESVSEGIIPYNFEILFNLSSITSSTGTGPVVATYGRDIVLTLSPVANNTLPESIKITVFGRILQAGSDYTYSQQSGEVKIYWTSITSNIQLQASAPVTPLDTENPPQGGSPADSTMPSTEETLTGYLDTAKQNTPAGATVELEVNLKSKTEGDALGVEGQIIGDELWDALAGTDTILTLHEGDATWEIDCSGIPEGAEIGDINFGVLTGTDIVPAEALAQVPTNSSPLHIRLSHDGDFGFPITLRIPFDESDNGKYTNLFYYNDTVTPPVVEYTQSVLIENGEAVFTLTHASDYFVILSDEPMDEGDIIGAVPEVSTDVTELFTDIDRGDWYVEAIQYAYDNELMNGTTATTFEPNATATRAMIWTIFARMNDAETEGGEEWYSLAMAWAMEEGITDGTNPEGLITREELVTMLYRMAAPEAVTAETLLGQYTDADAVSDWAVSAMEWAVSEGILTGKTESTLVPGGNATRAEIATIVERFIAMQ